MVICNRFSTISWSKCQEELDVLYKIWGLKFSLKISFKIASMDHFLHDNVHSYFPPAITLV
jgi:hypothetical protein